MKRDVFVTILSLFISISAVRAGSLDSPGVPGATMYTLGDIYQRLTASQSANEANHAFKPGADPAPSFYTLKQIYDAIPTIEANKVKSGASYLGVSGTLLPEGGTANASQVLVGKTFFGANQDDWNLKTGTMSNIGQQIITPGAANQTIVAGHHDGTGFVSGDADLVSGNIKSGITIFGVDGNSNVVNTSSGDAAAANILSGKVSWVDGSELTGAMANNGAFSLTSSSSDQTVAAGYYSGGTLAGDADLATGKIANGVALFGISGSLLGDTDASKVLSAATYAGTYNASNLSDSTVKKGTSYGVSSTGAYSGYPGTGWSGTAITQSACDAQNPTWYWFADGNGDGDTTDTEDGVCVRASTVTSSSWNGAEQIGTTNITSQSATAGTANSITKASADWTANAYANEAVKITSGTAFGCWGVVKSNTTDTITVYGSWLSSAYASNCGTPDATSVFTVARDGFDDYDNSWIGDWTCAGSFPSGAPSWGSFPTSAQVGAGAIALATTDCYDGTRDLLPAESSRAVKTGTATAASAASITDTSQSLNTNAWVGQKALITGGTGSGGYGRIESNTGTVITVDSWTGGTPGVGSTFAIIYLIPHATYNPTTSVDGNDSDDDDQLNGNNGPLTQEVLNNWKGTRLPTASDFFGFCGYKDGGSNYESTTGTYTADKTYGNYGGQAGRTDEFLDLVNNGSWEWLSEQHYYTYARIAGPYACSYFNSDSVPNGHTFRAVFRP